MIWEFVDDRERPAKPTKDRQTEFAVKVRLKRARDGEKRNVTVEYMEQGPMPTAFDVVRPYLDARQLPRRFVVDRDGTPEVVERYGTDF